MAQTPLQEAKSRFRLAGAWADALWRRWRRTGSLRFHATDRYDTAPRRLSPTEVERVERIIRRHCGHEWVYMERQPGETYTGYCEQCRKCGAILQVPQ